MRTITTEIIIEASAARVWSLLTDFASIQDWSSFLHIKGKPEAGSRLEVTIHPEEKAPMTFKPKVLSAVPEEELRWVGRVGMPGVFDGEHQFYIETTSENACKLVHKEDFSGILVPLMWKQMEPGTRKGFETFNTELKRIAESPGS